MRQASKSITDLLARAEAAEASCETLEKVVKEYQDTIVPGYREQSEKAEKERDAAVKCIDEIEDALNFKRISAIGLRISEYCGQKEE